MSHVFLISLMHVLVKVWHIFLKTFVQKVRTTSDTQACIKSKSLCTQKTDIVNPKKLWYKESFYFHSLKVSKIWAAAVN
jgi:hypothetical protein